MTAEIIRKIKGFISSARFRTELSPAVKLICTSISLFIFLSVIRANIIQVKWGPGISFLTYFPKAFISAYYDSRFVLVLIIIFGFALFLLRGKKNYHRMVYVLFVLATLLTIIAALLNKQAIYMIGNPFSYQWLYYSDFMGSQDAQNTLIANASWKLFGQITIISVCVLLTAKLLMVLYKYFEGGRPVKFKARHILLGCLFFVCYSLVFNWYQDYKNWQYTQLANPIAFFVQSVFNSGKSNSLFTMTVSGEFDDLPGTDKQITAISFNAKSQKNPVKNVIIFVLESVPAEYVDVYGSKFGVTPEISKLVQHSARFSNAYAHSPSTNNSMVSILGSVYPWISYKSLTKEFPEVEINTLGSFFKQQNYRTAFYSAADLKYQRAGEFLLNQQFDNVEDFTSTYCRENQFIVKGKRWENPDGADDECMLNSFNDWVDAGPDKPFFATFWTVQTHYPYFYSGKEIDYQVNDPSFNRYLNALYHADQTLGKLMDVLEKRKLSESTLLVIVGDHGEAFGRHNQYTHASKIYEENVHVPLLFVNKNLFHGESNDIVSGHVDIAPTIMGLLKFPADKTWQGHDLFNGSKKNRTYFFAPWSEFLFGYRENNLKFIYNATSNATEVYDLEKDPQETKNIVGQLSQADLAKRREQLAKWVQYQDKFIKAATNK